MNCNTTHYRANSSSVPGDPTYRVHLEHASALHRAFGRLEVLDEHGAPRIAVPNPWSLDGAGRKRTLELRVEGCTVDEKPSPTWARETTKLQRSDCEVVIDFRGGDYPLLVDPEWKNAGNMTTPRTSHTATLLTNHSVLVMGGFAPSGSGIDTAEIFCPADVCPPIATFTPLGTTLTVARGNHTATLVSSNQVLLTGGRGSRAGGPLASGELCTGPTWACAPVALSHARADHTATLLASGNVLVAGGDGLSPSTAEVYDPATGFGVPFNMTTQRAGHAAALLTSSGKVLVAGGIGSLGIALQSAELYDPATGTFTATGNMTSQRAFATATRLEDAAGSVLVAGGTNGVGFFYKTADVFVPSGMGGSFQQQPVQMQTSRAFHQATGLLGTGKVLITGGFDGTQLVSNTEVFDLATTAFTLSATMQHARAFHTATLLSSGQALVTGGGFNPASNAVDLGAASSGEILVRSNGEVCVASTECGSGFCIGKTSKICCDTECGDICSSCRHDALQPLDGICHVVADNTKIQADCSSSVQVDLTCVADAITAGTIQLCHPYACKGSACGSGPCATDAECADDSFCALALGCQFKNAIGAECAANSQCQSGFCADGYCCNVACADQCNACDDPSSPGTCLQVHGPARSKTLKNGLPTAHKDCAGVGAECAGTCGTNEITCDYAAVPCGTPTCTNGSAVGGTCSLTNLGSCETATTDCGAFSCNAGGTACNTQCSNTVDCAPGHLCTPSGTCVLVQSTQCDGDHHLVSPDGTTTDCAPFKCNGAACINRCKSVDDCVAPKVCDDKGGCIDPPPNPKPPTGCSFATPDAGSGAMVWALALVAALARRERRRRLARVGLALAFVATCAAPAFAEPLPVPPATPADTPKPADAPKSADNPASDETEGPNPANRPESEEHFNRAMQLYQEEAWTAALAEFLRSRALYPTRNATNNAAFCLRKLARYDEALDMYESMMREYPNMSPEKKVAVQKEVTELRALVGTIDVIDAEPGASVLIDGKARADFPLIDPLRVGAGSHTVRLFKEGFHDFEENVDVAGGQTVRVVAKMSALTASGRLRVAEKGGQRFDVVVDGAVVGVTPWEGSLAVGDRVVFLRGDGNAGTPPANAAIKRDGITTLTLASETLDSAIAVEVMPASGDIVIDAVRVGHGVWDGKLKSGPHTIEVEQDGFFPQRKDVTLKLGEKQALKLQLERDDNAKKWRKPSKVVFDLSGGFAVAPTFGGDISATCTKGCSGSPGLGGLALAHGGYQFPSGLSFGVAAGYFQGSENVKGRSLQLSPVGISPGDTGTASDDVRLRGFLVGVTGGYHFFERFPLMLRLGAGALIGNARSDRTGSFTSRSGASFAAPALESAANTAFVYIDPEATIGVRFGDHFELAAGGQVLVLISASPAKWGDGKPPEVVVQGDGLSHYNANESLVGTMVVFVPGLRARADF